MTDPPPHRAPPAASAPPGPRLDADLHARPTGLPGLAAAMAVAAARGLTDLGIAVPAPRDGDRFDAYVGAVRAAGALTRTRIHCGVELRLGAGGLDLPAYLPARLSRVDYVILRPDRRRHVTAAALRAAGVLGVPVLLAAPLPDPAVLGAAGTRTALAVEVSERRRTPSVRDARRLADSGVILVAGSGASHAAGVGRWVHVRAVAAALGAPEPHPG